MFRYRSLLLALGLILVAGGLSAVSSELPAVALRGNLRLALLMLFFFCCLVLLDGQQESGRRTIYRLLYGLCLLLAAGGVFEAVVPQSDLLALFRSEGSRSIYPRIASFLLWPNQFGIVMSSGLAIGEVLRRSPAVGRGRVALRGRLLDAAQLLLLSQCLQSGSRTAWGVAGILAVFLLARRATDIRRLTLAFVVALVLVLTLPTPARQVGFQHPPLTGDALLPPRFFAAPETTSVRRSAASRLDLYRGAVEDWSASPWTGLGVDVFERTTGVEVMGRRGFNVHSLPLAVLVETGVLGVLAAVWLGLQLWQLRCRGSDLTATLVQAPVIAIGAGQLLDWFLYDFGFMVVSMVFVAGFITSPGRHLSPCCERRDQELGR